MKAILRFYNGNFSKLSLAFGVLFLSLTVSAQVLDAKKIESLVRRKDRPTVSEVLKALNIPLGQPFRVRYRAQADRKLFAHLQTAAQADLPNLAVLLEQMYPNGKYAFLGRDASGAADLLEAFYLSLGQNDRVIRLRSSGASLYDYKKGAYLSSAVLADYLVTNGAPLQSSNLLAERPFVIVDATSMGGSSQSTKLATAGIEALKKKGYSLSNIYSRLAVADISNRPNFYAPATQNDLFAAQKNSSSRGIYGGVILGKLAPQFSYFQVQGAWHNTFGLLTYKPGTKEVSAKPGALEPEAARLQTIKVMLMLYEIVQDPAVRAAVAASAQSRNVVFKPGSSAQVAAVKLSSELLYAEAQKKVKALTPFGSRSAEYANPDSGKLSNNGDEMSLYIKAKIGDGAAVFEGTLPALAEAYETRRITATDFRLLLGQVLEDKRLTAQQLTWMEGGAQKHPVIREFLNRIDYQAQVIEIHPGSKTNIGMIARRFKPMVMSCKLVYGKIAN